METRNFIDGKFITTISKRNIPVLNPANQKIVANIDEALDDEIDLAFNAAKKAFDQRIFVGCGGNSSLEILKLAINGIDISVKKWESIENKKNQEFSPNQAFWAIFKNQTQ